jgi:hypothetical protein
LNHTPTPAVNPDLSETDGWQGMNANGSAMPQYLLRENRTGPISQRRNYPYLQQEPRDGSGV